MKIKLAYKAAAAGLLLALAPVSLSSLTARAGTSVGNAQRIETYWSPAGNFSVSFDSSLTFAKATPVSFTISNEKIIPANTPKSSVAFSLDENKFSDLDALGTSLEKKYPGRKFTKTEIGGGPAFASVEHSANQLDALYGIINGDKVVYAKVKAFEAGEGIRLIAPIVESFSPDITPPDLLELRLETNAWVAGTTQIIHIKAKDDSSGPSSFGSLSLQQLGNSGQIAEGGITVNAGGPLFSGELLPEENGWYRWEVPLSPNLPDGDFVFTTMAIDDKAGNVRFVGFEAQVKDLAGKPLPRVYQSMGKVTAMAPITVRLMNPSRRNIDVTAPVFHGYRPDDTVWEAGSEHRVYFRVTDDNSGFDWENSAIWGLSTPEKEFYFGNEGKIRSEGNDWYSVLFRVPALQPSGLYQTVAELIRDKAENGKAKAPAHDSGLTDVLTIRVHNSRLEDRAFPRLRDWRLESNRIKPGATQKFLAQIAEAPSGITYMHVEFTNGLNGESLIAAGEQKQLGNGWFEIELPIDSYALTSTYFLKALEIGNGVGKKLKIACNTTSCRTNDGSPLPAAAPAFEVVR